MCKKKSREKNEGARKGDEGPREIYHRRSLTSELLRAWDGGGEIEKKNGQNSLAY